MLSFEEALERLLAAAPAVAEVESLATRHADRRVLAQAQMATVDSPPLDNSAMDGYAVAVADVPRPGICLPVTQRIPAGSVGSRLQPGSAARIFTGAPLPPGADAVVMQELCEHAAAQVRINHLPQPGEHIRRAGSDIAAGSEILACGQRLRPQDTALAASVGIASLPVFRRLRVALLSTGDELRMPGETLPPGAIYNANRFLLTALLERLGCIVDDAGDVVSSTPQAPSPTACRRRRPRCGPRPQRTTWCSRPVASRSARRIMSGQRSRALAGSKCGRSRSSRASRWLSAIWRRTAARSPSSGCPATRYRASSPS